MYDLIYLGLCPLISCNSRYYDRDNELCRFKRCDCQFCNLELAINDNYGFRCNSNYLQNLHVDWIYRWIIQISRLWHLLHGEYVWSSSYGIYFWLLHLKIVPLLADSSYRLNLFRIIRLYMWRLLLCRRYRRWFRCTRLWRRHSPQWQSIYLWSSHRGWYGWGLFCHQGIQ